MWQQVHHHALTAHARTNRNDRRLIFVADRTRIQFCFLGFDGRDNRLGKSATDSVARLTSTAVCIHIATLVALTVTRFFSWKTRIHKHILTIRERTFPATGHICEKGFATLNHHLCSHPASLHALAVLRPCLFRRLYSLASKLCRSRIDIVFFVRSAAGCAVGCFR